jgi:hypothetical protein
MFGPSPPPSFSPMYSIGASSRSPSPITMVAHMSIAFSLVRIASHAAWSASSRLPLPTQRLLASAAASVTWRKSSCLYLSTLGRLYSTSRDLVWGK